MPDLFKSRRSIDPRVFKSPCSSTLMPRLIREISASLSLFGRACKIQFLWPQPLWSHDIFYLAGRRQEESCHLLARLEWVRTAWEHTVTEYTLWFYKPVCVCDWFAVLLHVMLCCFTINMSSCCQWRNITNYIYFNSSCCSDNCSLLDYFHFLLPYTDTWLQLGGKYCTFY